MISEAVKKLIEKQYGKGSIRYPKDCDALAGDISTKCQCKISSSTIKRLYGFNKLNSESPRVFTLDIIANYIGYPSYDDLLAGFKHEPEKKDCIEILMPSKLKRKEKYVVSFGKLSSVLIEYKGMNRFTVLKQEGTELVEGDTIIITKIERHLPLFVQSTENSLSEIILGKITGVTEIKRITTKK